MLLKIAIILLATICMSAPKVLKNSASHNSDKRVFVPRVINGWPAKLEDVPYQISLKSLLDRARLVYYNFCGGALIGPEKIVSAAHCFASSHDLGFTQCGETAMCVHVSDRTLEGKFAVAGTLLNKDKYNGNGQWRTIANVYYPDAFTLATEVVSNDIAVGYVNTPFDLNSDVAPIPYTSIHRDYHGMCLVSGYGFTEKGRKETPSPNLLLAHLDIISISSCSILFKKHMRDHVCTSVNVTATGPGDSGGPLVCSGTTDPKETSKGILVGVVSGGTDFGGYSTRVSSFITEVETCRGSNTYCSVLIILICLCLIQCSSSRF